MKETPILFSAEMIRAILENRKRQTRRVIKPQPQSVTVGATPMGANFIAWYDNGKCSDLWCPYGQPGDRLVFLCTWAAPKEYDKVKPSLLPKDVRIWSLFEGEKPKWAGQLRPGRFMPKWMRPLMPKGEIDEIRPERVNDISEDDAKAEGIPSSSEYPMSPVYCPTCKGYGLIGAVGENLGFMGIECKDCDTHRKRFLNLFNALNAKRGYGTKINPWVWVIGFHVL